MRLLDLSYYESIFLPLRGLRVGLVDGYGNIGDELIYAATRQLLDAFEIDWILQRPEDRDPIDKLLLFGGGSMGSWYVRELSIRRRVLKRNIPTIVLPQSFMRPEPGPYERVYVREHGSLELCPEGVLAPDLALGYEHVPTSEPPVHETGLFFRVDREGRWPLKSLTRAHRNHGDPLSRCRNYHEYLDLAGQYGHIITDRLHFAISGLLNRRRVTLLPNNWHKNQGIWKLWLSGLGCEWADSPHQVDLRQEALA